MDKDESILIRRILDGHDEDYGYFIERYADSVNALVARLVPTREDAEELVQDAFVNGFTHLDSFLGNASFLTWISRIAYRCALSHLRRRRIKYIEIDERIPVADTAVDEAMADSNRTEQLRRAIGMLKPDEKALVTLYYYDNLPIKDIAYITGMEPGSVATRLHRIRKKLYIIINNDNGR